MGRHLFHMVDTVVVNTTPLLYLLNMFSAPCLHHILVCSQDHSVVGVVMQGFEMVLACRILCR
jgi:CBS-domain-containing membrane protein